LQRAAAGEKDSESLNGLEANIWRRAAKDAPDCRKQAFICVTLRVCDFRIRGCLSGGKLRWLTKAETCQLFPGLPPEKLSLNKNFSI